MPKPASPTPEETRSSNLYTNDQIVNAATGQWGEKAQEIKPAEPYVIARPDGSEIVIAPLTRRRRKALKAAQAAYLMTGAKLAEVQQMKDADQGTISQISRLMDEAEYEYDKAVFGAAVDEVIEYFDELDESFWDAMYQDVHDKLINRVEMPEGVCPKCGHPAEGDGDAGGEGKDASSSTSSTGTGTKLKATSGTT